MDFLPYLFTVALFYTATESKKRQIIPKDTSEALLYKVTAFNAHERSVLHKLQSKNDSVIFLNEVTNEAAIPMDVIVNRCCREVFEETLQNNNIEYSFINIDSALDQISNFINYDHSTFNESTQDKMFPSWEDIITWTEDRLRLNSILKKKVIATTFEKREIFVLTLSLGKKRPGVVIMSGEQGRDWLSPGVLLNFINKLLKGKQQLDTLLYYFDFHFIPILNADGYTYSMNTNKFWAKNRKSFILQKRCVFENGESQLAVGVNIDRNWFLSNAISRGECNSIFIGHSSLSEEETWGLAEYLNTIAGNTMAFINLRGMSNKLVTIPYGYTKEYSINHDVMIQILTSACEDVYDQHNVTYFLGTTANYFYNHTGNVGDWVKKQLNIPIVYTVHLKHKSDILPQPEHIEPLTQQFATLLVDSLLIAKDIYGPLFNKIDKLSESLSIIVIFVLINFFTYDMVSL